MSCIEHDCVQLKFLEEILFVSEEDEIEENFEEDNICPICYKPLGELADDACCGTYVKQLECGHNVHVVCQLEKTHDILRCHTCLELSQNVIACNNIIEHMVNKEIKKAKNNEIILKMMEEKRIIATKEEIEMIGFDPRVLVEVYLMVDSNDISDMHVAYKMLQTYMDK